MSQEYTAEERAEAAKWGFSDVAAWKDAMQRSGMLEDMGYQTDDEYAVEDVC